MSDDHAVTADPTNAAQLRAWDGDEGAYWAVHAERFERSAAGYNDAMFAAAAIGADDAVLDIGCGTGPTTRAAAQRASSGSALGVDLSSQMIEYARKQAAQDGIANARFEQGDAQIYPFAAAAFDVAISRFGSMFFGEPVAAFTNIGRALRPDGELVLLTWQTVAANEWIREVSGALAAGRDLPSPPPDVPSPFALSDPDRVRSILAAAGFVDVELESLQTEMRFGENADDVSEFIVGLLGWMLDGLDDAGRTRALAELRAICTAHESNDGVHFGSSAWLVRARRPARS